MVRRPSSTASTSLKTAGGKPTHSSPFGVTITTVLPSKAPKSRGPIVATVSFLIESI
jgi:hypothetical protein